MMKTMNILRKTFFGLAMTLALFSATPAAHAAIYNFTIQGLVSDGDESFPNDFNLTAGDIITATGSFTANLGTIGNETGTVSFATGSGNTMSINLNGTFLFASDDIGYGTGGGPSLDFLSGSLTNFDFYKSSTPYSFDSYGLYFDDFDALFGTWTSTTLTPVPVPAAVWLFGSGLLGLVGIARRKKRA
jgi:hypothetical protein